MAAFDPTSGAAVPAPGAFQFQQLPDGRIRPAQAPPASDIYGDVSAAGMKESLGGVGSDLKTFFAHLFGGGEQSQGYDAISGAAPAATSQGALPGNNQPAAAQGGSQGNQSAAAPALAGGQAPPASPTSSAPEMVEQELDRAKSGAKANPDQAKQMAEVLEGTGVDPAAAYDELFEQLGGVEKPETELTKEEKGLFIMSFGLRMMAASETMSAGGAFGAAGVPTVGEMRGLKQQRQQTARDVTQQRRTTALELLRERMRQQEGALDRAARPETYDSAEGLRTYNPATGEWELERGPESGQPIRAGVTPGGHARDSVFMQKYRVLIESGVPEQQAGIIAGANARSVQEQFAVLQQIVVKDPKVKIRGRKAEDWPPEELNKILMEMAGAMFMTPDGGAQGAQGAQGGGALQPQPAPQQPQPAPQQQGGLPPAEQLSPGTVVGGYEFKGGDPQDPRSWQKAQ